MPPTAAAAAESGVAAPVRAKPGLVRAVMENLEALAIAIVMALVLKYFLIEAYKIPTGSMQPGIMGDHVPGIFDRVLVNKLVYLLRDPERFEVVVFKNPLWQRQNYIKRLIGLPDERITLRNGDIFVSPAGSGEEERIARKPDAVWRSVRKSLLPELGKGFEITGGAPRLERDRVVFPDRGATASIATKASIRDGYLDGYDPKWVESYLHPASPYSGQAAFARSLSPGANAVSDVELAADVTPAADSTSIVFELREAGRIHRATLAVGRGEGSLSTTTGAGIEPIEWEGRDAPAPLAPLHPGVTTRVSFRNVDDELVLEVGDEAVLRRPYRTRGVDPKFDPQTRVQLETSVAIETSGVFTLTELGLWRDIHYLPDGQARNGAQSAVYTVPSGEYMVLGDNTQNSWDCRQWEMATYHLKDGREIPGNYFSPLQNPVANPDSNPGVIGSDLYFRNVFGQQYVFPRTDLVDDIDDPDIVSVHSFPKDFLLGKAIAVFWPLPPVSPTWRLRWVR